MASTAATATNAASLEVRIKSATRVIRDATAAALKFVETDETVVQHENVPTSTATVTSTAAAAAAEFDLAMTLFGDDTRAIEEEINSKLLAVENDLYDYFARKQDNAAYDDNDPNANNPNAIPANDNHGVDYESFGIDASADAAVKTLALENEAHQLNSKINFLQKCSTARVALDEANTCSLEASCGTRKAIMVQTAQHLARAKKAIAEAEDYVRGLESKQGDGMKLRDAKVANDIIGSIKSQITRKTVDLHAKAASIIDSCITITPTSIYVCEGPATLIASVALNDSTNSATVPSPPEATYEGLKVAIEVLATLSEDSKRSRLEDVMQVIADELLTIVLRPSILATRDALERGVAPSTYKFHESTAKSSIGLASSKLSSLSGSKVKGMIITLEWSECSDAMETDNSTLEWWSALLQFIQRVTKFMCDQVLNQGNNLYPMLGRAVFGKVSGADYLSFDVNIIEHGKKSPIIKMLCGLLWEYCIPDSSTSDVLTGLTKVSNAVTESATAFETFLVESSLIENPTALAKYGNEFEQKHNEKVRTSILGRGRKILLDGDYHNSVKVGVNVHAKKKMERPEYLDHIDMEQNDMSLFLFEECGISQVAFNLMELCTETMELAVNTNTASHALLPPTLYRASRELLDLFRATIPAAHGSEIATIPRTAAVFHNDCVFFAHKMLSFGLEYRDRFLPDKNGNESPLKQMCTFLDLVPIFRELADRRMNDMIQHQKIQLSEIISPRMTYIRAALGSNEGVVEWTDAETALTAGLYHLRHLSQAWKSMLAHDVYSRTMGSLVDALFTLYVDQVLGAKDISVPACHFVSALFKDALRGIEELFGSPTTPDAGAKEAVQFCTLHHKFSSVGKFMNMSLADINMALPEGVFQSVTGSELARLVCAVFEDSDKRRKLLRLLESN